MFTLVKKLFGIPSPEELQENGEKFYRHLQKLDDANLPVSRIRDMFTNEELGRLLRHAQRFPWKSDDELIAQWQGPAQWAIGNPQGFWIEYQQGSVQENYLVFDVFRNLPTKPSTFVLRVAGATEKNKVGTDGVAYDHYLVNQPAGDGAHALLFRIRNQPEAEGVLHVGTCRVFVGKRRLEALAEWDKEMMLAGKTLV